MSSIPSNGYGAPLPGPAALHQSQHYSWDAQTERRRQEAAAIGAANYAPRPVTGPITAASYAPRPISLPLAPGYPTLDPLPQMPGSVGLGAAGPSMGAAGPGMGAGPSAWNSSGTTWEQRSISSRATPLLEQAVRCLQIAASDGLRLQFTQVTHCIGTATLLYSRGQAKPRPGYEYNLSARWELLTTVDDTLNASGMIELFDIADTESDTFSRMHVSVDYISADTERSRCEKLVHDVVDDLRVAIRRWSEMLARL